MKRKVLNLIKCNREDCKHNIKVKKKLCCTIPYDNTVHNCNFGKKEEEDHEKDNKKSVYKSNEKKAACEKD